MQSRIHLREKNMKMWEDDHTLSKNVSFNTISISNYTSAKKKWLG